MSWTKNELERIERIEDTLGKVYDSLVGSPDGKLGIFHRVHETAQQQKAVFKKIRGLYVTTAIIMTFIILLMAGNGGFSPVINLLTRLLF